MTPEPVVVTGVGLVNPLGNSASEVFSRLRRGDLAGKRPERFDSTGFSCHVCAQVEGFDPEALLGDCLSRLCDLFRDELASFSVL